MGLKGVRCDSGTTEYMPATLKTAEIRFLFSQSTRTGTFQLTWTVTPGVFFLSGISVGIPQAQGHPVLAPDLHRAYQHRPALATWTESRSSLSACALILVFSSEYWGWLFHTQSLEKSFSPSSLLPVMPLYCIGIHVSISYYNIRFLKVTNNIWCIYRFLSFSPSPTYKYLA